MPKAVIPVHLYGQVADMDSMMELAGRYGLTVIEDSCQAHSAQYFSQKDNCWKTAGSIGHAGAFSYYPGKNLAALQGEIRGYLDQGYEDVKIKIGGAPLEEDLGRIEAVLEIVGRGTPLAVDANGRFDAATALRYGEALARYRLKWYEEPGDPLDFELLAQVSEASATPLATGENLLSLPDSLNLIRYGRSTRGGTSSRWTPGWATAWPSTSGSWRC